MFYKPGNSYQLPVTWHDHLLSLANILNFLYKFIRLFKLKNQLINKHQLWYFSRSVFQDLCIKRERKRIKKKRQKERSWKK